LFCDSCYKKIPGREQRKILYSPEKILFSRSKPSAGHYCHRRHHNRHVHATEASAVAVIYSFILSVLIYKEIRIPEIPRILLKTAETTAVVMLLIGTSRAMSWILSYENIPQNISSGLTGITDNRFIILMMINLMLLIVGTFMDITPAVLIFTPILLPVVTGLGMSPLHFGIMLVFNLCIGLCTPPVGSVLFVGLPFYAVMVAALMLITYFSWFSEWLPKLLGLY